MSSVQSEIECPQCKYKLAVYEWSSHGYEWMHCGRCGHGYTCDHRLSEEIEPGCGATAYYDSRGIGAMGRVSDPTKNGEFMEWCKKNKNEIKKAYFTFEEDGHWYKRDCFSGRKTLIKDNERIE